MRQGLSRAIAQSRSDWRWQASASRAFGQSAPCCVQPRGAQQSVEDIRKDREKACSEAVEAMEKREGSPLPYPGLRVESHTGAEMHQVPHYPEAYLESKHCKVFAHWQRPRGVAEWTGFLAAQAFNAGAAAVAHVPAWLPGIGIPQDRVWLRRLLLLESIAPIPASVAAAAGHIKALWKLQPDTTYVQAFQQESQNAGAHLIALLSAHPSAVQKSLILLGQALAVPPAVLAFALSPRMCHAFMTTLCGLTGEALTDALRDLDAKKIPGWDAMCLPAPVLAHWGLPEGASMRSVLLVLRADVNARMVVNQGADFKALSLNAELSTLAEYFNKEDTLDYTKGAEDVHLPGDLYGLQKKGAPSGTALGQARQLATQAALPAIRERRPSGLRRFWGPSSASSRAPSVASQASSEQDLTEDVQMESSTCHQALRQRTERSPGSSASSDLDSAQGRPAGLSKGFRTSSNSLQMEIPEDKALDGGRRHTRDGSDLMSVMDTLWALK
ncbi:hypothetical protein CVIRNUC_008901 [Coccomyxa viridis]|uniref:Ubiquinol oxidase n=1 Tax=Coccomyxa viridis TaxID=1274662 RepID=A0AAV1II30_9CHLO|nr:hypothetical protein CVIRNUC_008901 [Coccomyxa viridis]